MGHTKNKCWRKNDKGPSAFTKFFEVLVNDEEATLAKLNCLCGIKHNVFYGIRMPKKRMHVQASIYGKVMEELLDNESGEAWNLGLGGNIRSKILSHFVRGKIFLTPIETILIVRRKLEYFEGLVKLTIRRKDAKLI